MVTAMSIVKVYNKKAKVTYVYESESYWDKEKQQPRNRRKLIGKIDPATGEIVPTGKPGRKSGYASKAAEQPKKSVDQGAGYENLLAIMDERNREIETLKDRIQDLESQCKRKDEIMDRIRSMIDES